MKGSWMRGTGKTSKASVHLGAEVAAPVTAPALPQFLPGSFLGLQLMVDLVLGKDLSHLPLYRQVKALEWESGVKISPATLCQTLARTAKEVEPVVHAMADDLWRAPCVQFDLTPVRCLSREHAGGSFLGQMWNPASLVWVGGMLVRLAQAA
ncbi:MAG: transposase [Verrucomicrobiota bacterium]